MAKKIISPNSELVSIEELGKAHGYEDALPTATSEDQCHRLATDVFKIAEECARITNESELTSHQACHLTANRILQVLDGNHPDLPAFDITPIPYNSKETWFVSETDKEVTWNYGQPILTDSSLASRHASIYEVMRDKLSISAADLFD